MVKPEFFDVACQVRRNLFNLGYEAPELLKEMDRNGIAKALIRDHAIWHDGAVVSNRRIVEIMKNEDPDHRLYGVWCILPEQCGELLPPVKFFDAMEENNIHAITLHTVGHQWKPCRLTIKNYMAEALERKIPVLLDGFLTYWDQIQDFMEEFPDNIYITLENCGKWGADRKFRPLMDAYPNLYFSIDGYWVPDGIPELVKRYGADRILFGSRCPQYYAGSAMLQLKQAGLSDEDFAKIASGNLERLLKGNAK